MSRILIITSFLFLLIAPVAEAKEAKFDYNDDLKKAYDLIMSLRFEEATAQLNQLRKLQPNNLAILHIENYKDCLTVFINEDYEEFKRLLPNREKRLNKIRRNAPESPYTDFVQAEIRLQWSVVRLKFEEYFSSFTDVNRAYKLLTNNLEKYPDFIESKKSLGVLHALIGTVPNQYKWVLKLIGGMKGSINQGIREIEEVIDYGNKNRFFFHNEMTAIYSLGLMHLKGDYDRALDVLKKSSLKPDSNPLACFIFANVAAHAGWNDIAIDYLTNRPIANKFEDFHYLDFMLGMAKIHRLDTDSDVYLERFVDNFRGRNYIKEAYQKLAWFQLIHGKNEGYFGYIKNCLHRGAKVTGEDEKAYIEAKSNQLPNVALVTARLLFDGGYYQRAASELQGSNKRFTKKKDKLEYDYRMGRIKHMQKDFRDAISYYEKTIKKGRNESYYFACNAALQTGKIYEVQQDYKKAIQYFKLCLGIDPDEYRKGLHQQAKAGLNRIEDAL